MAEDQQEAPQKDERGDEVDMSAHIPEGDGEGVERDMAPKTDDLGEGLHPTSKTFGTVVSDYATDAEGKTPQDVAEMTDTDNDDDK